MTEYRITKTSGWIPLGQAGAMLKNSTTDRLVYKTKNGKLFISHRPYDEWLRDKYQLEYFMVLPE